MIRSRWPSALLLCSLATLGCVDAPSALARTKAPPDRPNSVLYEDGNCTTAAQQFYTYYGFSPVGLSCTWTGYGWVISVSFYWTEYGMYPLWYGWLGTNGYDVAQSCGDSVLDDIMASYSDRNLYTGSEFPRCNEFTTTTRTQYFTHADLSQGNGTDWAWLKTALVITTGSGYGADTWREEYGSARTANSGYRTPMHNHAVSTKTDSRHMHGDALDLANVSMTNAEWDNMYYAAQRAHADYIESLAESHLNHVHADWRAH